MSLLTSYGTNNRIIECGKTKRITCSPVGDPVVTVYKGSDGKAEAVVDSWYKATCVCAATYSYVGMDYATASECAQAMISKFTRQKTIWEYGVDQTRTTEGVFYWLYCKLQKTGCRLTSIALDALRFDRLMRNLKRDHTLL